MSIRIKNNQRSVSRFHPESRTLGSSGVIVLMPVAFLVVIPFISSKIVKVINQTTSVKIRKSDPTIDDADSTEDTIEVNDSTYDESEME